MFDLPFPAASFDHVFACFVLKHLARPVDALFNSWRGSPVGRSRR